MTNNGQPLVSIITPSYNQGEFIEDCILSVKNQTYINIEHIIIDGVSMDSTIDILKKHENTYNLLWMSEEDRGQADAIRKGFSMARGDIVTWLNTDDYYLHDEVISEVVSLFKKYKGVDVITGEGYYVNRDKRFISSIVSIKDRISLKHMCYADYIFQPATFVKKKVHEKVIIDVRHKYIFDWLYFLNILENGFNIMAINNYWAAYRMYDENKTGQDNSARKKEIAYMAKRNFSNCHPQVAYCFSIYILYKISETLPYPIDSYMKSLISFTNKLIGKLTSKRVYSC